MSQASRCLIVPVLAIAGFGCREDSQSTRNPDVPADSATVFLSDSASVDIVRISNLDAVDLPQVEKRLIYSTAADFELDHVVGAVFLPDSSLVVADRGSSEQSGQSLALFEPRPPLSPGLQRGPLFLVLGDDSWKVVDTLGRWVGKERHLTRESGEIVVGFGATALFDGRGLHTVVGTNDSLDVTLYQRLAPLTRIRGGHSPRQVTARHGYRSGRGHDLSPETEA